MSDLEKILNDDLLKCKIVESVENPVRRVDGPHQVDTRQYILYCRGTQGYR